MTKRFTTFLLLVTCYLLLVTPVHAQCGTIRLPGGETISTGAFAGPRAQCIDNPGDLISLAIPIILAVGGFVAVIVIIISGIQFVTSGGNPEAAAGARSRLTFAIVGLVIIILAFLILQIIDRMFLGTGIA